MVIHRACGPCWHFPDSAWSSSTPPPPLHSLSSLLYHAMLWRAAEGSSTDPSLPGEGWTGWQFSCSHTVLQVTGKVTYQIQSCKVKWRLVWCVGMGGEEKTKVGQYPQYPQYPQYVSFFTIYTPMLSSDRIDVNEGQPDPPYSECYSGSYLVFMFTISWFVFWVGSLLSWTINLSVSMTIYLMCSIND